MTRNWLTLCPKWTTALCTTLLSQPIYRRVSIVSTCNNSFRCHLHSDKEDWRIDPITRIICLIGLKKIWALIQRRLRRALIHENVSWSKTYLTSFLRTIYFVKLEKITTEGLNFSTSQTITRNMLISGTRSFTSTTRFTFWNSLLNTRAQSGPNLSRTKYVI